ncbi:MAG: hypothetical protein ACRD2C_08465 [Acidimicrobiales bacterium]
MWLGRGAQRWLTPLLVGPTALLVGGLAACSGDDDSSDGVNLVPTEESDTDEPDTGPATGTQSLTGLWEGTYQCGGGEAGLTLAVDDRGDGEVAASFEYFPVGGAADGSTGRYSMDGTLTEGQLSLTGQEWQAPLPDGGDQPMVGIEADLANRPETEHLEGTIVGDGCSGFSLDRTSTEPWYVGAFSGTYACTQGVTGIDLTLEDLGDRVVGATYDFYAVAENPGVPSGSYRMEGTYLDGEMVLSGTEWIEQPADYLMVDLRIFSELGIDPNRLYGTVRLADGTESGCSIFGIDRVEDDAASQ